jgi:hypothetical protein
MVAFSSVLVGLYSVLFMQQSPWIYYAYAFFPVMFWEEVWASRPALVKGCKVLLGNVSSSTDVLKLAVSTLGFFGVLEALVSSLRIGIHLSADFKSGAKLLPKGDIHYLLYSRSHLAGILRHRFSEAEYRPGRDMGFVMLADERVYSTACE